MPKKEPQIEAPRLRDPEELPPEVFETRGDYLGLRVVEKNYAGQLAARLEIVGCHFRDTRFNGSILESAHIGDTIFENCDLAGANWEEADLHRVEFIDCRLTGFCAPGARLSHVVFRNCQLGLAQLRNIKAKSLKLEDCLLSESDWSDSDLRGAILHKCNLQEADFFNAKLQKADVRGSDIEGIRLGDHPAQNIALLNGLQIEPLQAALLAAHFGLKVHWNESNG